MFLPVKYYHCHSFHTVVQTDPSLLHPDLEQLLYTTSKIRKKLYIKKKDDNFQTFTPSNFPLVEMGEAYLSILSDEKHFTSGHSLQVKYFSP